MTDQRPNPDQILAQVREQESKSSRGRLKIFFGAAPGVGKTYAMLEEARKLAAEGVDIVIGYAEPHIRPDTEALLLGLEIQPYRKIEYKNTTLKEFDIDAILTRKPTLVCVDELAHTNANGLRHPKRYQDIFELLEAGISVYTTLNVQHLESVNDVVERISGIKVRETLPDWVLERADEVQLIDIPPEKLIERIEEGKFYRQHQLEHVTRHFFNAGNLSALRELALRRTADRVDAQMSDFQKQQGSTGIWPTAEKLLVCVGPSPFSTQLIRATRRMAAALKSQWYAVYVETPRSLDLPEDVRARITQALRLAENLGGQAITLTGDHPATEIIAFARSRNIARIITGKPQQPRWREWLRRSMVDDLIRNSGSIDIMVMRDETPIKNNSYLPASSHDTSRTPYVIATGIVASTTALGWFLYHVIGAQSRFSNANVLMLDLLGVLWVSLRVGRGPALFASFLAVVAFDVTVVPPYYSLAVSDTQYLLTFAAMFVTALAISTLTDRLKRQGIAARLRERRTAALLDLARDLAAIVDKPKLLESAAHHIAEVFDSQSAILLPDDHKKLIGATPADHMPIFDEKERSAAEWVFENGRPAGATTDTLPASLGLYIPLRSGENTLGVIALTGQHLQEFADPDRLRLLEAYANIIAVALERAEFAETAKKAWERVESEFIRNTLLSGVSHDLRTPLAAITGSVSALIEGGNNVDDSGRRELLDTIADEADRMEKLINNLLDMTRLESGRVEIHAEPYPLAEVISSVLGRAKKRLADRQVKVTIPADLPLILADGALLEQVIMNIIDNALQYTPPGSPLEMAACANTNYVEIRISDSGPGLPIDDPDRVFQKFYRAQNAASHRGVGLGLAICRQIMDLHHGGIRAENRPSGGASFIINIPIATVPPVSEATA